MPKDLPKDIPHKLFYSSLVTEHIVPKGNEEAFERWYRDLVELAAGYTGFVRCDLCPPLDCIERVVKCYYIIHFDTPENLSKWIDSRGRQQLLKSGQEVFYAYRFKSFTTGLEGWFSMQLGHGEYAGLGPPRWKQILAVVLGLYPVVMLQSLIFSKLGLMQSWSLANAMIVNNLITSTILSLLVMPFIAKKLRFWLKPAYLPLSRRKDLLGLAIVALWLMVFVLVFNFLLLIKL
ncbi:MAG: hypothetical protein NW214_01955 [Pseudanabaenaceae cyanobacterium bins.39]|nr:hypothetical protein [Pseudanabaenaceae cyanobacterium bins.39]